MAPTSGSATGRQRGGGDESDDVGCVLAVVLQCMGVFVVQIEGEGNFDYAGCMHILWVCVSVIMLCVWYMYRYLNNGLVHLLKFRLFLFVFLSFVLRL